MNVLTTIGKFMKNSEPQYAKHIAQLGLRVKDKVTGLEGVVTAISFDLYGCVQAIITTEANTDGKSHTAWFDISRLVKTCHIPVMDAPDFARGYIAEGKKGAAYKPLT